MSTIIKPRRRLDLLRETVAGETLLYDEICHKAYCLNPVASFIWQNCDGHSTPQQIGRAASTELKMPVTEDAVLLVIKEFHRDKLIESMTTPLPVAMFSRRDMAIKLGVGAAMAMPVIATVIAPKAAQAYSGCVDC